jgi:glucose/arabinose dehydrogenase
MVIPTSTRPLPTSSPTKVFITSPSPTLSQPSVTLTGETLTNAPPPAPTPTLPEIISTPVQFPNPATYEWRLISNGLTMPIGLANAGDGSGRLFVLEQPGMIRIIQDGELFPDPFLDLNGQVGCCGERGLLGLAFHPDYKSNGYFYVNYTDLNGNTKIARFQVSENSNLADPVTQEVLLGVMQPFPNHNGGGLAFGLDGYLYIGLGDGGSGGDPLGNAQNLDVWLGKLLRLDIDHGDPYTIPADNPYAQGGGAPEVWASGLRNPWRFSFDRLTGDLYIGDVGQGSWEEIDYYPAGGPGGVNFGWNYREGAHTSVASSPLDDLVLTDPVTEYGHDQGVSVVGGIVYRGEKFPELQGIYFYGDYGSGNVWGLYQTVDASWENALLFQTGTNITSFGEDESGEIYFVDHRGSLFRLEKNDIP